MKTRLSQARGISLISVVIAMLLLALLGSVMVSMVTSERYVGVNQIQGASAQYLAEAGLERALFYFFNQQQSCVTDANVFNVTLGNGRYNVATVLYAPAALTLNGDMTEASDNFTVDLAGQPDVITAGYAPYGIVVIGTENIECAGVSGNTFSSCKRGVGGTTVAAHPAATSKVYQEFCIVNATGMTAAALAGNAQRVVSIGFSQFDLGWAVGDQGTVLQWNGIEWLPSDSPTSRNLRAVKLTSVDRGWIAGDLGVMGQLNGAAWTKQRSASMYLSANNGDAIAMFDTDPHEIGQAARVTYASIAGGGVTEMAATPNGKYLYVSRGNPHNDVVVIDPAACWATPGSCDILKTIPVGVNPLGIAVSPDGLRVYVANGSGTVTVICRAGPALPCGVTETSPANDVVETTFNLNDTANPANCANYEPRYIALTMDGRKALVTTGTSGCVKVLDLTGGVPPASIIGINLGDGDLWGIAMHPNNYYAYVAGRATGQVFAIDTVNNSLVEGMPVNGTPSHISYTRDGLEAYVSRNSVNRVLAINTASNTAGADVPMADAGPTGVAASVDGSEIYVTNVSATGRVNIIRVQDKSPGAGADVSGLVAGSNMIAAPDRNFRSISMLGETEGWAVGDDGRLLHWDGAQWITQPLVTMPTSSLPSNTVDNGDGTWTTTIEPEQDTYVRMNDDVQSDGVTPCGSPLLGCSNADMFGVLEPEQLKLRRVNEDANSPNAVGTDLNDPNNPNKELYRPYLKFDLGVVKQYALSLLDASLQLYAFHVDAAPAASSTATSGLVMRYKYENDPGVVVSDSSTYSPPNQGSRYGGATYYGVGTCTDCLTGAALSFDGVDGRVIVPPSNSLKIGATTNRLTVETWVHFANQGELAPGVTLELVRKGLPDSRLSYRLWISGGKPAFSVRLGNTSPVIFSATSTDPSTLQVNQTDGATARWYHLVGTYDGAAVRIYQDGILKGQVAAGGMIFTGGGSGGGPPPPPPPPTTGECGGWKYYNGTTTLISADGLCIGGVVQGAVTSFNGWLDETRIYNAALTAEQVEEEAGWGERPVNVYRVGASWSDSGLAGGNQHACQGSLLTACTELFASTLVNSDNLPKWVYWNVTRLIQKWVDDTYPNYGLVLRVGLNPGETDPSPRGILWLHSVDAPPPNNLFHPRLIVAYRVSRRPNLTSLAMVDTTGDKVADDGWAVGEAGLVFRYKCVACVNYNGSDWTLWTQNDNGGTALPTKGLHSVSMRNNTEGWAVGDEGTMLHFIGGRWVPSTVNGNDLTSVSIAPNGKGIAVGKNGVILSYDGAVWNVDPAAAVNLTAIKAFSNAKGWGAGEEGKIIRKLGGNWVNQGDAGTVVPSAVGTTHLRDIDMLPQQSTVTDWRENQ
jgi:DNA-binding beta-propeller fold protein YncE/Tfp pilus assembly protein PilX